MGLYPARLNKKTGFSQSLYPKELKMRVGGKRTKPLSIDLDSMIELKEANQRKRNFKDDRYDYFAIQKNTNTEYLFYKIEFKKMTNCIKSK